MYHSNITPDAGLVQGNAGGLALQPHFWKHDEALGNAAVLLGGRRGARLINSIREALSQSKPLNRRVRRQLLELRNLLFLEYDYDENWDDDAGFASLEPSDPIVPEICLLAEGWEQALHYAGMIGNGDN